MPSSRIDTIVAQFFGGQLRKAEALAQLESLENGAEKIDENDLQTAKQTIADFNLENLPQRNLNTNFGAKEEKISTLPPQSIESKLKELYTQLREESGDQAAIIDEIRNLEEAKKRLNRNKSNAREIKTKESPPSPTQSRPGNPHAGQISAVVLAAAKQLSLIAGKNNAADKLFNQAQDLVKKDKAKATELLMQCVNEFPDYDAAATLLYDLLESTDAESLQQQTQSQPH